MDERDDSAGGAPRPEREREREPAAGTEPERVARAADRERADRERAERERVERSERAERERAEWIERERAERVDRSERERGDRERADRSERERMERERMERERLDRERFDREQLPESLRQRLESMVPEMVKRTFSAGLGALFSTEENLRKLAKDINIPDVAGYLASTADSTKDKVLEIVAREVRDFLEHVNLSEEVAKLLTTLSFEVRTEIRFVPNSERYSGVDPSVKASVRLKRNDKAAGGGVGGAAPAAANDEERGSRLRFWRRGSTAGSEPDAGEDEAEAEPEPGDDERTGVR